MKRIFAIGLSLLLAFICVTTAVAADEIAVIINGTVIEFDVPPQIIGDRTMVPMRVTFESLGAKIEWIGDMRLALATYGTSVISMRIGESDFTVTNVVTNETKVIPLDVPAQIVDGRTLIPLRAVSEALGKKVEWNGSTRTATITG